jgi:glycosyltransferase involved in cell wall biosynthesis
MVVHAPYPQDVRVAREVRVALTEGYEVDVFAIRRHLEPRHEWSDGARVFRMPFSHRRGAGVLGTLWEYVGFTLVVSVRVAVEELRRRYDVVQVHNPPDFLIIAAVLPRSRGARLIFDIHDLSPDMLAMRFARHPGRRLAERVLYLIESWATRLADVVITVHEPYRRELVTRGVSPERVSVVMNTVDEGVLPRGHSPTLEDGRFRIVYHGTITPSYGVDLLVEAVAQVRDEIPNVSVEIYGEGDSVPPIAALAQELGIADQVYLPGRYFTQEAVLERVSGADVGVIPNLANRLNRFALSSKLFEYVALRIPVVSADLPTIRAHFTDDELLFFRPGDARSLAAAFLAVARDPIGARKRATAAFDRYKSEYHWKANAERYASILNSLRRKFR